MLENEAEVFSSQIICCYPKVGDGSSCGDNRPPCQFPEHDGDVHAVRRSPHCGNVTGVRGWGTGTVSIALGQVHYGGLAVPQFQGQNTGDKSVCASRTLEIPGKSTQTRPLYANKTATGTNKARNDNRH